MKILVYAAPTHGHVNPMLPLLHELVSRGHEVIVSITPEFEPAIRHTGATVRLLDERFTFPELPASNGDGVKLKDLPPRMMGFMRQGLRGAPALLEQARAEHADALLYDPMALWGGAVAGALGLPAAIFQTTFAMKFSPTLQRRMRENFKGMPPVRMALEALRLRLTSEVLHWRHGLRRMTLTQMFSTVEDLYLVPIPRSYQPEAERFDERFVFVGPSVLPRNDTGDFPLEWLDGRPLLYISLGTTPMNAQPAFYKACFEAFGGTRWQVVIACGKSVSPASLGALPSNILVRPHVPQLELLQRARVFLTHGGMNSTMESFWHGVPMAVFPQFADQPFNAERVQALGAGLTLDARTALDPKALRDTVERLDTEPSFRTQVARLQKEVREAGGHRRAADVLLQYFSARRGSRAA